MPYVRQERRQELNFVVDSMKRADICADGDLNYVLFKFCKDTVKPGYNNYKNYIGELEETIAEIRRRFLAPYEDKKIEENGDV
jgi:hypothetical protein